MWDTPASLYVEGTGTESKAIDSVDTALIQDTTLPGYLSEWKAARKVCFGLSLTALHS